MEINIMNDTQYNPWHCSDVGISRESDGSGYSVKPSLISGCSGESSYAGRVDIFEHDDTAALHNYSGCRDQVFSAIAEHEDWVEGYDY